MGAKGHCEGLKGLNSEDKIAASFVMCMIPIYCYFEFFIVLPDVYAPDTTSFWFNLVSGNFKADYIHDWKLHLHDNH